METQLNQQQVDTANTKELPLLEDATEGPIAKLPPASEPKSQWEAFSHNVAQASENLPLYISKFYKEYKLPIISFAVLVAVVSALKIAVAVLAALNDIPLVQPTLELIGIGYVIWFTSRYLLKDSTRQELGIQISNFINQVSGKNSSQDLS